MLGIVEDLQLSPEELNALKENQMSLNGMDLEKCDVFQLGLSCLYTGT
jgi:hypothetical protein